MVKCFGFFFSLCSDAHLQVNMWIVHGVVCGAQIVQDMLN